MISLEIEETMVELSLAALEASAGERMGRRKGWGERGGEGRGGEEVGLGVGGGGRWSWRRGGGWSAVDECGGGGWV